MILMIGVFLFSDIPLVSACSGTCEASCTGGRSADPAQSCSNGTGGEVRSCCVDGGSTPPGGGTPGGGGGDATVTFSNPLQFDTVEQVLSSLLIALQGIIVTLSIVFIVIGAVLYITSAGNDKQTTMAKTAIVAAMIGLAIGIAAPTFLREIYEILGAKDIPDNVSGATPIIVIVMNVLKFLLSIVGALAIIMLVVGGIRYLTAAGSEDAIDSGKKIVVYAIIGILIALASLILVTQVAKFF